jgi:hypothetical protein
MPSPGRCAPFMFKTFLYITCLTFVGCLNPKAENSKAITDNKSQILKSDTSFEEPDPGKLYNEMIKNYSTVKTLDTIYEFNNDTFKVNLKYYCTYDSGLHIPAKYNFFNHMAFVSHNYKTIAVILKNQDTIFNSQIDKQQFKDYLYPELDSFAVLFEPELSFKQDTTLLDFSISIPVTDVGIGLVMKIDPKGNYKIAR